MKSHERDALRLADRVHELRSELAQKIAHRLGSGEKNDNRDPGPVASSADWADDPLCSMISVPAEETISCIGWWPRVSGTIKAMCSSVAPKSMA